MELSFLTLVEKKVVQGREFIVQLLLNSLSEGKERKKSKNRPNLCRYKERTSKLHNEE